MDPCGMVMDLLHSFYRMPVRIWVGGQEYSAWIRWYKAPPGALFFPGPTCFKSDVFCDQWTKAPPGPGEIGHPRKWDRGINQGYKGQCFVGQQEWFETGQLPGYILSANPPPFPDCCQSNPAVAQGGIILGGEAVVEQEFPAFASGGIVLGGEANTDLDLPARGKGGIVLGGDASTGFSGGARGEGGLVLGGAALGAMAAGSGFSGSGSGEEEITGCSACPDGAAAKYVVTLSGLTNGVCTNCSPAMGSTTLTYVGGCQWQGGSFAACFPASAGPMQLFISANGDVTIDLPGWGLQLTGTAWNCMSTLRASLPWEGDQCTGSTVEITIAPE